MIERPTSILTGATYLASADTPRRHPALTNEQIAAIRDRLFSGWESPIPQDELERLFETDHYSDLAYLPASTAMFAVEDDLVG